MKDMSDVARRKAQLANRRAELSATKRGRLEEALQRGLAEGNSLEVIPRRPEYESIPLSFAQQRLWFLNELEPDKALYNLFVAVQLRGSLKIAGLEQSVNEIIRRHESLRTNFVTKDGNETQVVRPALALQLPIVDLRNLSADEIQVQSQRLALEASQRPYDLERESLIRITLLQQDRQTQVVLLSMHHIVSDGWSMGVFIGEMGKIYGDFCAGEPSRLPELSVQYADYSYWQRQWLQGKKLEGALSYWKRQLSDVPVMNLLTDKPRPAVQTFSGSSQWMTLTERLTTQLRALSKQQGVTLFITLLSAFQALLSRYSGQDDVAVGTPIAGRSRIEVEPLIGFFVNTLVMRGDLSGDPTYADLIARMREVVLQAQTHQDLPFEKLVEELHPERSLSHSPLFQVMFILNNTPPGVLEVEELSFNHLPFGQNEVKFDLTLSIVEGDRLEGSISYNTDLFHATTIGRMVKHFQILLESMAANPQQSMRSLPLLTEAERHHLLNEWNDTHAEYKRDLCLHELIEVQVERAPDAAAITYEDQHISYAQMNRQANQLAHSLIRMGVGPEARVALYMKRGLNMVIGMLGILKAGGAYVPLDPEYPPQRLAYMLEDSRAAITLSEQYLSATLPETSARVVFLDGDRNQIALECEDNPRTPVNPENIAYVIYTSGSTGNPKGVAVRQEGLINFVTTMAQQPGLCAEDVLLAVTSLSFDISMLEIYLPLVVGGRVIIVGKESAAEGERLIGLLTDSCATHMQATPATWRMLLEAGWLGDLRLNVLCGGEALPRDIAETLSDRVARLWNLYGPTETTIWSTLALVVKEPSLISIGRPIANTQVYILDEVFQPLSIGIAGELYIGGDGLARGYLNRPDITAERFICNPFGQQPGSRLYRTGDLARYKQDGGIEFLGRIDHQVKIRGFRIELGEIESVLKQHPAIEQAVVVAQGSAGDSKLIAYVVGDTALNPGELRLYLQGKLPTFMVPSAFVRLESMPLTPNGKIDRQALPKPDFNPANQTAEEPRNALEEILCGVWAGILGLDRVGVQQNFFELGGHSLLATRVILQVHDLFNVELPLRTLFENPTVSAFTKVIERERNNRDVEATPIRRARRDRDLPLSYAQQRLWFMDKLAPGSAIYNIPAVVRFAGSINAPALGNSINEIIRRHEVLRTIFIEAGGQCVQIARAPEPESLPIIDLGHLPDAEREAEGRKLAEEESQRPFDLPQGPHLRCHLIRLSEDDHIVLFTMHHIVSDGWSEALFIKEITTLYKSFSRGEPSSLEDLRVQYADYAVWQRECLTDEALDTQLGYWKHQLRGQLQPLNLPTDRPRPAVTSYRGAREGLTISNETGDKVKALSRREGVTLFMVLLAAFDVLLHSYTGQEDMIVGTDVANRNRSEIEGIIGFFINQVVMRVDLSGNPTFQELLVRVREVALGAYTHQDLPFEKLVEVLKPERFLNRAPIFQATMLLQNIAAPTDAGGLKVVDGLKSTGFQANLSKTSKLDLNLVVSDTQHELVCALEYSTDLFDAITIKRFLKQFEMILQSVAARPEMRLSELAELVQDANREELIARQREVKQSWRHRLKNIEPKTISGLKKNDSANVVSGD